MAAGGEKEGVGLWVGLPGPRSLLSCPPSLGRCMGWGPETKTGRLESCSLTCLGAFGSGATGKLAVVAKMMVVVVATEVVVGRQVAAVREGLAEVKDGAVEDGAVEVAGEEAAGEGSGGESSTESTIVVLLLETPLAGFELLESLSVDWSAGFGKLHMKNTRIEAVTFHCATSQNCAHLSGSANEILLLVLVLHLVLK